MALTKSEKEMILALDSAFELCFDISQCLDEIICNSEDDDYGKNHDVRRKGLADNYVNWYIKKFKKHKK